jgi:folate-binding protein YgfZ
LIETAQKTIADYAAVRHGGAALVDLSGHEAVGDQSVSRPVRSRILVNGSEALMFTNGLITNDMKALAVNSWMPAAFPNVQGRLLASIRMIHRADGFLIDTEITTHDKVLKLLDRFTLAGDFRVTDLTHTTAQLSVQGRKAADIIRSVLGEAAAATERQQVVTVQLEGDSDVTIIRATHTAEDGFDLFLETNHKSKLVESIAGAGAVPLSAETLETLRIEAGIPMYGVDMDETNVVTETNLDDAVSFTKGCYIGQEIIARIKYRGHVAKKLTGLVLNEASPVERGVPILSEEEKDIGRVTSATFSPSLDHAIALGYVKYDYLKPGTKVKVGGIDAEVAELPFVRGSWY